MNFSVTGLFLELALILMPGFIWTRIHVKYGAPGERTAFDIILNSAIFGVVAYTVLFALDRLFGAQFHLLDLDLNAQRLEPTILIDVFEALIISLVGSIVYLYIENYKLVTQFLQWIKATHRYGDEDVWDFVLNSKKTLPFVNVRDFSNEAVFTGYVVVFSESGELRELFLGDVIVYDFSGVEQYRIEGLYIARDRDDITIEFPSLPASGAPSNAK
ncbi:MAG: hypothetical protein QOF41_1132 [Methylobacteriaceae bacterium]|nr:hypothetical protein [Methylobacteriaceae bacterium]